MKNKVYKRKVQQNYRDEFNKKKKIKMPILR